MSGALICWTLAWAAVGPALGYSVGYCSREADVVESFFYPSDEGPAAQLEFLVVGRRVAWADANSLCPSYTGPDELAPYNTSLASFSNDNERNWLARMLSESNYRYEGLWIAGSRKNRSAEWRWAGERKLEAAVLSHSLVYDNYPAWYSRDEELSAEQNCLLFGKIGHDVPVFIPENCRLARPFVCMRNVKKRQESLISEAGSVSADGYQYTLYRVNDDSPGRLMRKLNGGGVTWQRAQFECRKRGQHLAMLMTAEAAAAVADLMLKSRPSMENAWLGARSTDGAAWTWTTSGATLPSSKAPGGDYPPWLEGHPVAAVSHRKYARRERCLILDRHLCPEQIAPVFLDLDCGKERPFVCQDGFGEEGGKRRKLSRRSIGKDETFEFSEEKMTFPEAEAYCAKLNGQVANVLQPKYLSAALDKMSELSVQHVWIGGRTRRLEDEDEWVWVDANNHSLSAEAVAANAAWCYGANSSFLPRAGPDLCLNLDYEARGMPLLYGLPCNASQLVLCGSETHAITPVMPEDVDTRHHLLNATEKPIVQSKNGTEPGKRLENKSGTEPGRKVEKRNAESKNGTETAKRPEKKNPEIKTSADKKVLEQKSEMGTKKGGPVLRKVVNKGGPVLRKPANGTKVHATTEKTRTAPQNSSLPTETTTVPG